MSGPCWLRSLSIITEISWQSRSDPLQDKVIFMFGSRNSSIWSLKTCPEQAMQARGRPYTAMVQKASSSPEETLTLLQNSVLKKSQTSSIMTNFFQKITSWLFECSYDLHGPMLCHTVPAKKCRKFHHLSQNVKGKVKISVFEGQWKSAKLNIRKWAFKEEKIKPISPKPIYTCCGLNQSHCAIASVGETLQR